MTTQNLITGNCIQCGEPITPATNQVQFNRNRGLHMRRQHGVPGRGHATTTLAARKAAAAAAAVVDRRGKWGRPLLMTPAAIAKREYQAKWRHDHAKKTVSAAKRAQLDAARQSRWSKQREAAPAAANGALVASAPIQSAAVPCKLSECPVCHSRFYVVQGQ